MSSAEDNQKTVPAAAAGAEARSDVAASAEYRGAMADVYAARAVTLAVSR